MASKHDHLMQSHHLLITNKYPNSRIFRRDVGLFYTARGTPMRIGLPGQGDSWAIIKIEKFLIHVEFEYKIGNDRQSIEQKRWQSTIESLGGIYELVHNDPTASMIRLDARIKELTECLNQF